MLAGSSPTSITAKLGVNVKISVEIEKDYLVLSSNFEFNTVIMELPNFIELFLIDDTEIISQLEVSAQLPIRKTQAVLASLQTYLL